MREQHHSPSLLPYLASGNAGAFLKIALLSEDLSMLTSDSFPFLVVAHSDPLTRLIKAEFATDSGSKIRDVFLLVQRDDYRFSANQLAPLTNADIEGFWQKTHRYHHQHRDGHPLITLRQQIDKTGNLVPFQPLFFCGATKVFFHPPCPSCGMPLQQCSDDQLLDSLGLQQYARSLNRYLFCPSCFSSGRAKDFFIRRKGIHDPPLAKDAVKLIQAFGQLVQEKTEGADLPCIACSQNELCFRPGLSPAPPIAPFSFYPFFMLIYEAMSLNGLDFLALTSGASFDELMAHLKRRGEPGRALHIESSKPDRTTPQSFLFGEETRLFLEILYLKLSFLGQIVVELFPDPNSRQPDPLLYVDKIWVKLKDRPGLLPYLWNYELNFIDLMRGPLDFPAHPKMPPAYSLHLLGLIWFAAFLANSRQGISEVHQALERSRDRVLGDDLPIPGNLMVDAAFFPENVFWNPAPFEMTADWHRLWEDVLRIGWSMLQASVQVGSFHTGDELIRQIEQLRTRIKRELFSETAAEKHRDRSAEDEAIQQILSHIAANWRQSSVATRKDELEETLVLPSQVSSEATPTRALELETEGVTETVILAPPKFLENVEPAIDEEIFQETVLLPGRGLKGVVQADGSSPRKAAEELSKAVILGAPTASSDLEETLFPDQPSSSGKKTKEAGGAEEEMAETIILGHSQTGDSAAKKPKPGEEEDDLSATIILTSPKDRDKK